MHTVGRGAGGRVSTHTTVDKRALRIDWFTVCSFRFRIQHEIETRFTKFSKTPILVVALKR